jgi:hypothetical protein
MNDKLYKEYEYETEIGGQHTCTYTEWLEGRVLETLVQQSLSGSEPKGSSPKSCPKCTSNLIHSKLCKVVHKWTCGNCGHDF